ncbi:MAG: YceI family protein [Cyclobacteriaceae bacterium]
MKQFITICFFVVVYNSNAQKYKSDQGVISFFSEAAIEDISAVNSSCSGLIDLGSKQVAFRVTIADFKFAKSLMQQHFNEKYMESDKFPVATFAGTISNWDTSGSKEQDVITKGVLTIHGQSNDITIQGLIVDQGDSLIVQSTFVVELVDYKIKIPKLLWQNIAEKVEVKVDFTFEKK